MGRGLRVRAQLGLTPSRLDSRRKNAKTPISLTTSYSAEYHMFAHKVAKNKWGNCSAFALMGKADAACSSTHHNLILSLPTTPCFTAHPAVRCWKSELLIASTNLMLLFIVPHTGSLRWKRGWKILRNIPQSFQWEPVRALR